MQGKINITITILDSIHRPVFYLKLNSTLWVCPYLTGNTSRLRYEPNWLMLSIGLWRWYINITITILDIIQSPVFYLKQDVSETGSCIRLHVEPTHMGPIDIASLCLRAVLNPKKEPRKLCGPHSRSGLHGGERNLLLLPGTEKTIWSSHTLQVLSYHGVRIEQCPPSPHRWNTALGVFSQDGGKTRVWDVECEGGDIGPPGLRAGWDSGLGHMSSKGRVPGSAPNSQET
jgi:hypothetical protein